MKPLMAVRELRKSFPGLLVLDKVEFDIFPRDKIGLIGANGTGKTTLLRILMGLESIDYGDIIAKPNLRAGSLEQYQIADSDETVGAALLESDYSSSLKRELRTIEERMADLAFYDSLECAGEMERYNSLQSEFAKFTGVAILDRAQTLLSKLGASGMGMDSRIRDLSGGEKRKVALAKVLVAADSMDILLLDEPMNHLDIEAIEWLEEFICDFQGTVIVVSHDRYMLDDTVFRIFEIEGSRLRVYEGGYTDYVNQKALRSAIMKRAYDKSEKEHARQRQMIEKLRGRNRFDAQIRSKLIQFSKKERPENPDVKKRRLKIRFSRSSKTGGKFAVQANDLSKAFGDRTLFDSADFEIEQGEKVGLIGPNGCGKTTLLKMVVGEEDVTAGELQLSKVANVGYFDQGHLSLEPGNNLIEELRRIDSSMLDNEAKSILGPFGFRGDVVYGRTEKLSGGERARLAVLKLVLSPCNFLILDEPTNHLDLFSRDAVEKAVNSFDGTVIAASHDRYFLDSTCDHILTMYGGHVRSFRGNYTQYRSMIAGEAKESPQHTGTGYYVVRKGYTDWETGTRYNQGQRLRISSEELKRHGWALETKHLVME